MRAFVLLAVMACAIAGAFYIVWLNRASEKIIGAVIPIAIAALIGVGLSVFVFADQTSVRAQFPAVFLYYDADKSPFVPPTRLMLSSLFEIPELQHDHPERMADDTSGATLYHHLLQKAIVDILVRHHQRAWDIEISRFDIGGIEEIAVPVPNAMLASRTKISSTEIKKLLENNRFGDSRFLQGDLVLPPRTKIRVKSPERNPAVGEESEITFTNDFVCMSIKTHFSSYVRSLGPYRWLLGYTSEQDTSFLRTEYLVSITADFSRLRSGHPEMPRYKRWVSEVISELQMALDEQKIWANTRDSYILKKQLQQFGGMELGPERPLTLNPPKYQ